MKSPFAKKKVFIHTGHIGDIIAFLPIYFGMGGTQLVIKDDAGMCPMSGFKYDSLKPLLESQNIPVSFNDCQVVDYDMTNWRDCYRDDISLMDSQARYVNYVDRNHGHVAITEPWLKVEANEKLKGKVVFNRSHRYRNDLFPWKKVWQKYKDKAVFIGTSHEHQDFCVEVGKVDYFPTEDCHQVARAIDSCDLFVGNQSSACWIAMALRKPLIQEVFTHCPNSMIQYEGAQYCFGSDIIL